MRGTCEYIEGENQLLFKELCEFQGAKYLTMGKEASEMIEINDIGCIVEGSEKKEELMVIKNVAIVGVPYLDSYLQCKARVEPQTPPLGKCSKAECMTLQRYDLCTEHTSANLMFMYDNDRKSTLQAYAYGEVVRKMCGSGVLSAEGLLKREIFRSITLIKQKYIIKDVQSD